jgi:tRNA(fMet)-specific endonuclease VapC
MYILDTNTLIYFFKGMGNIATSLLNKPPNRIGIPIIVLYELEVGIRKSEHPEKRITQLQTLTSVVNILPFGPGEAKCAAIIRTNLEKQGCPIGPYDVLIAGLAIANKGVLVTHNIREFERIEGLHIEDWF